jgi:hypothetical protein
MVGGKVNWANGAEEKKQPQPVRNKPQHRLNMLKKIISVSFEESLTKRLLFVRIGWSVLMDKKPVIKSAILVLSFLNGNVYGSKRYEVEELSDKLEKITKRLEKTTYN